MEKIEIATKKSFEIFIPNDNWFCLGELQEDMNMLRTLNAIDLDGEEDE